MSISTLVSGTAEADSTAAGVTASGSTDASVAQVALGLDCDGLRL